MHISWGAPRWLQPVVRSELCCWTDCLRRHKELSSSSYLQPQGAWSSIGTRGGGGAAASKMTVPGPPSSAQVHEAAALQCRLRSLHCYIQCWLQSIAAGGGEWGECSLPGCPLLFYPLPCDSPAAFIQRVEDRMSEKKAGAVQLFKLKSL